MDVTAITFPDCLPSILNDISTSCFVSVDFELSGVVFKPSTPQSRSQTVQERYVEAKAAAERYQILQVGLTTCHEDKENGMQSPQFKTHLANYLQPPTLSNRTT